MKTRNKLIGMAIVTAFTLAIIGCGGDDKSTTTHVHEWGEWVQTKAPTVTEEGEETKTCATCGEKETRSIPKTTHVHQWGDWMVTTPPTTTAEGEETRTCATCGEKETRIIAKLETFTVTFHANGGTPEPQRQTIEKGKTATEPTGVTLANNTLDGWYKEAAFTTKWNFSTGNVTADITLHAKWTQNPIPDELLGTWEYRSDYGKISIVFTTNSTTQEIFTSNSYTVSNDPFSIETNEIQNTDEFPSGYKLNGKIVSSNMPSQVVGNDSTLTVFLNATKDKMINNGNYNFVFEKQLPEQTAEVTQR